jgi:predicted outer membrane repeat protein
MKQVKTIKTLIMVFLCLFVVLISVSSASAASTVYVNATGGNDSNNGTINHPYQTIVQGINSIEENGTVHIADGTYSGTGNTNLTITKNMNITGQSQQGTIINGSNTNWIFHINNNITVNIQNLTITNGSAPTGDAGAIYNEGTLTLNNSTFTNNYAYSWGGAIYNEGTLTVTGSTFTNNTSVYGGAIGNDVCTLTINNSTFTNNKARWNGGAIYNIGAMTVNGSTFTGNIAVNDGGAIDNNNIMSNITTVTGSTFTGNNAQYGGAIDNKVHTLTVTGSTFTNNNVSWDGGAIYNSGALVDAQYNWWGSNNGPASGQLYGHVNYGPWLCMNISVDPVNIVYGGNGTVIVSFNNTSDGTSIPDGVHIPDGTIVNFSSLLGTFNPILAVIKNGTATTTFTATNVGTGNINGTTDNQIVSTSITVNKASTTLIVNNVTGVNGQKVNLTATLTDQNGKPIAGQTVTFTVNGKDYVVVTDGNGVATLSYAPTHAGIYTINVNFLNKTIYAKSTGNATLTVKSAAYLYINTTTSKQNPKVGDTFILTYKLSNNGPDNATNVKVSFQIHGLEFVTASVDNGTWTYNPINRTVTWTLSNVAVGDPYLYLTLKASGSGNYPITQTITSETFNQNTNPLTPFTVNVQTTNNNNPTENNTGNNTVNAATKTIAMQNTGIPIAGLALAILAIFSGLIPKRK